MTFRIIELNWGNPKETHCIVCVENVVAHVNYFAAVAEERKDFSQTVKVLPDIKQKQNTFSNEINREKDCQ